ncbi:Peptidylprolyl isomerase [Pseudodesulfovibrio profundus]|uniref:Peptidylprolyl isomerase n=1 Tax=Pseudodesulfovibrio profundus TaxID=57320 RepID=A0A2C8F6G2_9BACT|nr:SurA N-terminal domain-containing protein [Pseudodesulfovibrio profundus]SOB57715.1 Peptidylprolyl isomerase [Pseudodesulfovibrio profundus]
MVRFLAIWFVLLVFPLGATASDAVYDRILVKINEDIITQYDLDEAMQPVLKQIGDRELSAAQQEQVAVLRKQALEKLVNDTLIAQEIERYGIEISSDAIDKEIEALKRNEGLSDDEFLEVVKSDGMTIEEFRDQLKSIIEKRELLGYAVHSKVLVTDTEIKEEYEARRSAYSMGKIVELGIIMLPPDVAAQEVKKRIEDGELTFTEAVAKYSIGPAKDSGGSIGEVAWADLADDWRDSINGVEEGEVGEPLTVRGNESLLSPIKIIEDQMIPLEDVRDDIFEDLMDEKRETVFKDYFDKLKQRSVIVYMD